MTELVDTGVSLPENLVDRLDEQADRWDTTRSAVIRSYLIIGEGKADELPDEEVRDHIHLWSMSTAPEMTEDGYHPRWGRQ